MNIIPVVLALDNDQVKALPLAGVEIAVALGLQTRHKYLAASLHVNAANGAYTNIDPDAYLVIATPGEVTKLSAYLPNDSSSSPALEMLTEAFNGTDVMVDIPPYSAPLDAVYAANWGTVAPTHQTPVANATMILIFNNQGAGALTGGHATNSARLTVYYARESL